MLRESMPCRVYLLCMKSVWKPVCSGRHIPGRRAGGFRKIVAREAFNLRRCALVQRAAGLLSPSVSFPECSVVCVSLAAGSTCLSPRLDLLAPFVEGNGTVPARPCLPSLGTDNDVVEPCGMHEVTRAVRHASATLGSPTSRLSPRKRIGRPRSVYRRVDDDAAS